MMFQFPNPFQKPRNPFSGQGIQSLLMPIRHHLTQQQDASEIDALMEKIGQMITSFPKPIEQADPLKSIQADPLNLIQGVPDMNTPTDIPTASPADTANTTPPYVQTLYSGISGLT